ncbi:MAG: bifunctional uroporphyrinogen-III C-methyltransferase/uroporphyrinogen-III synthase [Actinobacteria bacterium]|nr:bifunctional uroporphyrinogen-III C-methyltransferase/uroporphyrinogen-III synthase [Actinomycetota bacterium]
MTSRIAASKASAAKSAPTPATPKKTATARQAAVKEPVVKQPAPKSTAGKPVASTTTTATSRSASGKAATGRSTEAKTTVAKAPAPKAAEPKAPATKESGARTAPAKAKEPAARPTTAKTPAKTHEPKATPAEAPVIEKESPVRARKKVATGPVALVASGPGDPDLLTLRAARLLAGADVIIVDADAVAVAQAHAGEQTVVTVAVDAAGMPLDQSARSALVIEAAREGKNTVRLIAGDPVIDGTLLHEAGALRRARIDFEVAPGVSEVTGVPAYAGFGLTGGRSRQVRILDANDADVPWGELTSARTTLVFLDGADRAVDIAARLLAAGADERTPIAVTRRGTTVDQRTVVSTLGDIAAAAKAAKQAGRGLVVIGEVVAQREKLDWFEVKALFGWRILIPRTQDHAGSVVGLLRSHGAVPIEVPTISVEPPRTPQQIDRAVHGLVSGRYEWIGFTSVNAVRAIREKLQEYGLDARSFAGLKVAAVGQPTVDALVEFGVRPDIMPIGEQTTSALLDEWPTYDSLTDPINRVFLPRADIATDTLAAGLAELGWEVEDVTAYRTVRAAPPPAETREAIKTGGFDAVLFTSSSTVRNLVGIAGKPHHSTVVACIGPQTAKAAEEHGLRVDVLAETSTAIGLVEALSAHGELLRVTAIEAGEGTWRPSRRRATARRKAT